MGKLTEDKQGGFHHQNYQEVQQKWRELVAEANTQQVESIKSFINKTLESLVHRQHSIEQGSWLAPSLEEMSVTFDQYCRAIVREPPGKLKTKPQQLLEELEQLESDQTLMDLRVAQMKSRRIILLA